ncbi:MAG: potassium channel family protein [Myxococcaceae bacterium]
MLRPRRRLGANLRYFVALVSRFKFNFLASAVLFGFMPVLYVALYPGQGGERLEYGKALHHVYFLLYGQPSLEYVGSIPIEVLNLLIPPCGIAIVVDGIVRFAYLYFAKHRADKEWIAVIAQSLKEHVVVVGAGRIGFRVVSQLIGLGKEVVVVDRNETASFVSVLREMKVPVLIDEVKTPEALQRCTNIAKASAIVCATSDDLANLNLALDARSANPRIRVVIRLFDDDLVSRIRDNFQAEALSSSALAAPALALAALDPRIVASFQVGTHLMVVSQFVARKGLAGLTVSELRDRFGGVALSVRAPGGAEQLNPGVQTPFAAGDTLTVQCEYVRYLALREFTGEVAAPMSASSAAA